MFEVMRGRPTKLSDPYNDFSKKSLRELLAVPDTEMQWFHFRSLLGPYLPAGTYEESVYFLPKAISCLRHQPNDALDLITSVVWFVSEHAAALSRDGLLNDARLEISEFLAFLVQTFHVVHFDKEACVGKGWRFDYCDLVQNSEVICQATTDLVKFSVHRDLAEDFFARLAAHGENPVLAAWLLELARSRADVNAPPEHPPITQALTDPLLLEKTANVVSANLEALAPSPTYWSDTFLSLGLKRSKSVA